MSPMTKETEPHLEKFRRFEKETKQPAWLFLLRKAGMARFAELGFPTLREEDWRFTNVAPIAKLPFRPVFQAADDGLTAEGVAQFTFGRIAANRLVFVNGHYEPRLSAVEAQASGTVIGSLAAALAVDSASVREHLTRVSGEDTASFAALNTAFFQDGAFIHVAAGAVLEAPIHLLFISTGSEPGATSHPRNLILIECLRPGDGFGKLRQPGPRPLPSRTRSPSWCSAKARCWSTANSRMKARAHSMWRPFSPGWVELRIWFRTPSPPEPGFRVTISRPGWRARAPSVC